MPNSSVKALAEIAFRVNDLDAMQAFYEDIVQLRLMKRFDNSAFFEIAPGHEGHTQILALFDRSSHSSQQSPVAARSSVDHIAFSISLSDFESEKQRLESLGQRVTTATHQWVQWRSLYLPDPEGNLVELVCFDPSIAK